MILMSRRTRRLYEQVLLNLKELLQKEPDYVIGDYEASLRAAIRNVYTSILIGCWYHYSQVSKTKVIERIIITIFLDSICLSLLLEKAKEVHLLLETTIQYVYKNLFFLKFQLFYFFSAFGGEPALYQELGTVTLP